MSISTPGAQHAPQVRAAYCPTCNRTTDLPGIPCADCVTLEVVTGMRWHTCGTCGCWSLARPGRWCKAPECRGTELVGWRP